MVVYIVGAMGGWLRGESVASHLFLGCKRLACISSSPTTRGAKRKCKCVGWKVGLVLGTRQVLGPIVRPVIDRNAAPSLVHSLNGLFR